jgi:hypothetical protein
MFMPGGLPVEKNLLLGAYTRPWKSGPIDQLKEIYTMFPVLGDMSNRLAGQASPSPGCNSVGIIGANGAGKTSNDEGHPRSCSATR